MTELWDVQDQCPVEQPEFDVDLNKYDKLNDRAKEIHMKRFQVAVNKMPLAARERFLRSIQTSEAVVAIVEYGIRNQLTSP